MTAAVSLQKVSRHFGAVKALDEVDLEVAPGEFFAMLGPSGSGKTTCLRLIAGFEQPTSGRISIFGEPVEGVPPYRRNVNTVFQDYALFPHMTVEQNLAFGLCRLGQRLGEAERARIDALLRQFDLDTLRGALPRHLSGGQRQRVALARALAPQPDLLLLDEPLSALDTPLRIRLRAELAEMLERVQVPTLLVTHDPSDVEALAQSAVHLDGGHVVAAPLPASARRSIG